MGINISGKKKVVSEINVVPLVDIMLVLLVIFMITAPMMFNGINLQLPRTKKVNQITLNQKQVILSISKTGELFIDKEKILEKELVEEILAIFKKNKTDVVFIRADYGLKYGTVARVMSDLKRGGIGKLSLVTEIDTKQ